MINKLPKAFFVLTTLLVLASCVSVTPKSVQGMDDGFVCELLGPAWVTMSSERDALYNEIKRRRLLCANGRVAGYTKESEPGSDKGEKSKKTSGSGFIISKEGHVLTNHHVVNECENITVKNNSGNYSSSLVVSDSTNDLAILMAGDLSVIEVGHFRTSNDVRVGEEVTVVGYPLGDLLGTTIKASSGSISSLTGIGNDTSMLQINAPIQPGNSGGPLLGEGGNVVGMVTSKLNEIAVSKAHRFVATECQFCDKEYIYIYVSVCSESAI